MRGRKAEIGHCEFAGETSSFALRGDFRPAAAAVGLRKGWGRAERQTRVWNFRWGNWAKTPSSSGEAELGSAGHKKEPPGGGLRGRSRGSYRGGADAARS